MKAGVREMRKDEPDALVAGLRIAAYPQFMEVRQTDSYEDLYHWPGPTRSATRCTGGSPRLRMAKLWGTSTPCPSTTA